MENTSPDLLLILDSTNILTNYSILNCVYLDKYTPFIKQKDLFTLGQHSKIEVLAKLLEVSSDFLNVELKKIAHNFQQDKKINFPINLSLISRKWKKSKDVKKDIIVKSNSTETKSTEGEDPQDNTKQKDNSIIYLYSNFSKKKPKKTKIKTLKHQRDKNNQDVCQELKIEIPLEIFKSTQVHKKIKQSNPLKHQTQINKIEKLSESENQSRKNQNFMDLRPKISFLNIPLVPEKLQGVFNLKFLNEIDKENVPDFIYVTENLMQETLPYFQKAEGEFKNSVKKGVFQIVCNCKEACNEDCICARYNKQYLEKNPPYKILKESNHTEVLRKEIIQENIKPFTHIFECSELCSCNKDLCNFQLLNWKGLKTVSENDLIVKRYRKVYKGNNEEVFMWGLMTNVKIPKNNLVIEYLGEIISKGEADLRGKYYDIIGKNYLFDLTMAVEYKGQNKFGAIFCIDNYMKYRKIEEKNKLLKDFPLCIDGYYYGNLSRFINHSCNPNLQVLSIHVENREILLPRVVLFSTKEIEEGEELTFDYNCYPLSSDKELKCACGEATCRGFIYN